MLHEEIYRSPEAYICDIEVLCNKSYGTAKRIMAKIRKFYNLDARKRPTIDQVKAYLVKI